MSFKGYLPLNEYSAKYRISLSTLRRRIRAGEVEYRFEGGKYWLAEQPPTKYGHLLNGPAVEQSTQFQNLNQAAPKKAVKTEPQGEELFDSAKKMMQELKGAYVTVLHEKEEQIMGLKEEISDLKTLVKILESENERLRGGSDAVAPIDSWLEENT